VNLTITIDDTRAALGELIRLHPERTNNGLCSYEHDGAPNCIVGCFLSNRGVDIYTLMDLDEGVGPDKTSSFGEEVATYLREDEGIEIDIASVELLRIVQRQADGEGEGTTPWGAIDLDANERDWR
jgi:hypothetical protein